MTHVYFQFNFQAIENLEREIGESQKAKELDQKSNGWKR